MPDEAAYDGRHVITETTVLLSFIRMIGRFGIIGAMLLKFRRSAIASWPTSAWTARIFRAWPAKAMRQHQETERCAETRKPHLARAALASRLIAPRSNAASHQRPIPHPITTRKYRDGERVNEHCSERCTAISP
jgi:hypothetical protein